MSFHVFIHPIIHFMCVGVFERCVWYHGWQKEIEKSQRCLLFPLTKLIQVQSKQRRLLSCHFISAIQSEKRAPHTQTHQHTQQLQEHSKKHTHRSRRASGFSTGQLPKFKTPELDCERFSQMNHICITKHTHILTLIFHIVCLFACFLGSY